MDIRITPRGMDGLPLSLFTVAIGVPDINEEKLGPLSTMTPEKSEITIYEICGKEHTFQRAQDNSQEPEDVVDPRKNQRRRIFRQKTRVSKSVGDKNGQNTHLQVSDGRTRGQEVLVDDRQVCRWRRVAGKWPTFRRMENSTVEENSVSPTG